MPAGRPSKYDQLDLEQVKMLCEKGWTNDEMAKFFQIDRANWYKWQAKHEEFRDVLKNWKVSADERVEKTLYERALGCNVVEVKTTKDDDGRTVTTKTKKELPPDPTSMIFWLKNRRQKEWRDRHDHEITGNVVTLNKKRFDGTSSE